MRVSGMQDKTLDFCCFQPRKLPDFKLISFFFTSIAAVSHTDFQQLQTGPEVIRPLEAADEI
jgi:hypothetical protein